MDQHPIPQDVTGFQFKLIGSMTVKQFGFVASGVILAVICYVIKSDSIFWLSAKFILIPLFAGTGVIIAFVPIDGRPVDVMANNFMKALFSPNQYVYRRDGRQLSFMKITTAKAQIKEAANKKPGPSATTASKKADQLDAKEAKLRAFLMSSNGGIRNDLDKREAAFLKTLTIPGAKTALGPVTAQLQQPIQLKQAITPAIPPPIAQSTPIPVAQQQPAMTPQPAMVAPPVQAKPTPQPLPPPQISPVTQTPQTPADKEAVLTQTENALTQQLTQAQQEEAATQAPAAHQKVATLAAQIEQIHAQKQQLEHELAQLQTQLATQKGTPQQMTVSTQAPMPLATQTTQPAPAQDPQHVRTMPQDVSKKAGLPHVSDTPNVVVGIVKDPRGNVLANILVEVKDQEGNPVRAFKTNPLGQFASATPLSPGTYTMELEDPKKLNRFDLIQITANNQILPAMEVISHDAREDLRKQLFAS